MELPRLGAWLAARRGKGPGSIGLELGPDRLHLLQLERAGEGPRVRAALSLAYPEGREAALAAPRALRALVRTALPSRPFRGRRCVSALPAASLKLMVLGYELREGRSEPELLLGLVGERVGEPLDSLVIDYLPIRPLGGEGGERSALVAVAPRDAVVEHLERLRRAGLENAALEIAPAAIRRLVGIATGPAENAIAIHCGRQQSFLTVLWGRRLVLYRQIEFGERHAVEALAKALDTPPEEAASLLHRYGAHPPGPDDPAVDDPAAVLEISKTLMEILKPGFYALAEHVDKSMVYVASKARGASPDVVYLLGEFARWPRADRLLESLASIPVRVLDPRGLFPHGPGGLRPGDLEPGEASALVAGLALRELEADG